MKINRLINLILIFVLVSLIPVSANVDTTQAEKLPFTTHKVSDGRWTDVTVVYGMPGRVISGYKQDTSYFLKSGRASVILNGTGKLKSISSPSYLESPVIGFYSEFPDVKENSVRWRSIQMLVRTGIFDGFSDGAYRPNQTINRDHVSSVKARWMYAFESTSRLYGYDENNRINTQRITRYAYDFRYDLGNSKSLIPLGTSQSNTSPKIPFEPFTPREQEILVQVAHGKSNKQIAKKLKIADKTVEVYMYRLTRKLRVPTRVGVAVCAVMYGLVDIKYEELQSVSMESV